MAGDVIELPKDLRPPSGWVDVLGLKAETIAKLARAGEIGSYSYRGKIQICARHVAEFLARHEVKPCRHGEKSGATTSKTTSPNACRPAGSIAADTPPECRRRSELDSATATFRGRGRN